MTEISGPEGLASSLGNASRATSTIADAKDVHSCIVIPLKRTAKETSSQPTSLPEIVFATATAPRAIQDVRGTALARLREALASLGARKNVPVADDHLEETAAQVLDQLTFPQTYQLAGFEKEGIIAAVETANAHLDVLVMGRVMRLLADARETDIHDPVVVTTTQDIFARIEASLDDKRCIRWPDPAQMIEEHDASAQVESSDA